MQLGGSYRRMSRNTNFILLLVALTLAMTVAGIAGRSAAPANWRADQRRSTYLQGPFGASGFAAVLERFDVEVQRIREPLFRLVADTVDSDEWIAVIDPVSSMMDRERDQVLLHLARGGGILSAGPTGLERCFGLRVRNVENAFDPPNTELVLDTEIDYEWPTHVFDWIDEDAEGPFALFGQSGTPCDVRDVLSSAPLARTVVGSVVAWRFTVAGGGRAILLAESKFLSNEGLRNTDIGALVLPWLLDEAPALVAFDEYHLGFDDGGSIFGAVWRWMTNSPIGWALFQLGFAAMIGLLAMAIRFGPALRVVDIRRRSPLEHLSAVAVGLERAGGHAAAVDLIANGLRRRLSRTGAVPRVGDGVQEWLTALGLASRGKGAQLAIAKLSRQVRNPHNTNGVLEAAHAVEDVWEALREDKKPKPS